MNLEREEERSVIKALVVLESRRGYFKKTGAAAEGSISEELPIVPSPWLLPLDSSSLLAEGKRKVSLVEGERSVLLRSKFRPCLTSNLSLFTTEQEDL